MGVNDGLASNQILSIQTSGVDSQATNGSYTNLRVTTLVSTGVIGAAIVGSPAVFSGFIQAGTAGPLVATTGSIVFGRLFTTSNYVATITPQRSGAAVPAIISGTTTQTVSGADFVGGSGTTYNWIAVGF